MVTQTICDLKSLQSRGDGLCLPYAQSIHNSKLQGMLPEDLPGTSYHLRSCNQLLEFKCKTERYRNSHMPSLIRIMNKNGIYNSITSIKLHFNPAVYVCSFECLIPIRWILQGILKHKVDTFVFFISHTANDTCFPNQCLNGAACINNVTDYTCECPTGYAGKNCDIGNHIWSFELCLTSYCVPVPIKVNVCVKNYLNIILVSQRNEQVGVVIWLWCNTFITLFTIQSLQSWNSRICVFIGMVNTYTMKC